MWHSPLTDLLSGLSVSNHLIVCIQFACGTRLLKAWSVVHVCTTQWGQGQFFKCLFIRNHKEFQHGRTEAWFCDWHSFSCAVAVEMRRWFGRFSSIVVNIRGTWWFDSLISPKSFSGFFVFPWATHSADLKWQMPWGEATHLSLFSLSSSHIPRVYNVFVMRL